MRAFTSESLPRRIVFGCGAARSQLAQELARAGAERILLIAGASHAALSEQLAQPLGERVVAVFDEVRPHVPVETAERACTAARDARADWILSIGGGSTTGAAKAIARTLGLPIAAVPTTYAGSEMTPVWGITERGRKLTGSSPAVRPRLVVYDPELTVSLPARITAASAGNGLAHCIEAFYAPGANPIAAVHAEEGIRALIAGTPRAVKAPHDLDARGETLYGAYLAGSALAVAGTDLHHKLCHVLGGALDLPHAETHTIVLPHATAFVEPALPDAIRTALQAALGRPRTPIATALYEFTTGFELPRSLRDLGMAESDIGSLADEVVAQVPASTPRPPQPADVTAILRRAWHGTPP